jgi:hypothetical protein
VGEGTPASASTISKEEISVPNWLLQKPFRVTQKLVVELDGSAASAGLKQKAEHDSRLLFVDSGHWRFRQELPFSGISREILKNDQGVFQMTLGNRPIATHDQIADDAWTNLLRLPHDLSKRFGFSTSDSWGDWFDQVKNLKEEFKNADGDRIKVTTTKDAEVEKFTVTLEGSLPHEESSRVKLRVEWTLELNSPVKVEDLQKSLLGGA